MKRNINLSSVKNGESIIRHDVATGNLSRICQGRKRFLKAIGNDNPNSSLTIGPSQQARKIINRISRHGIEKVIIVISNKKKEKSKGTNDTGPYNKDRRRPL